MIVNNAIKIKGKQYARPLYIKNIGKMIPIGSTDPMGTARERLELFNAEFFYKAVKITKLY